MAALSDAIKVAVGNTYAKEIYTRDQYLEYTLVWAEGNVFPAEMYQMIDSLNMNILPLNNRFALTIPEHEFEVVMPHYNQILTTPNNSFGQQNTTGRSQIGFQGSYRLIGFQNSAGEGVDAQGVITNQRVLELWVGKRLRMTFDEPKNYIQTVEILS